MTRSRLAEILVAAIVVVFAAGCTVAGATAAPSGSPANQAGSPPATMTASAPPTPELTPSPTPALSPSLTDAEWVDRAQAVIRALGSSVASGAAATVSSSGPATRPVTMVRIADWTIAWDADGRLVSVVVVPSHPDPAQGVPIAEAAARNEAAGYLRDLGATLGAADTFSQDPEMAWLARWDRKIDGILAPDDGTRMTLAPNGTFLSYTYSETPAAPEPASRISEAQALAKFPKCKNSTGGPNGKVENCSAALEWHAKPGTDGAPLQLCWRMDYAWHDNTGGSGQGVMWVDAGTGETVDVGATM